MTSGRFRVTMRSFIAGGLYALFTALSGCAVPVPNGPAMNWEMVFSVPGTGVALLGVSSGRLFAGRDGATVQACLRTSSAPFCSTSDPLSGKTVIAESVPGRSLFRVYSREGRLLTEIQGKGSSTVLCVSLNPGGTELAAIDDKGSLWLISLATGDSHSVRMVRDDAPIGTLRDPRCLWVDQQTVAAGFDNAVYSIRLPGDEKRYLCEGYLVGTVHGIPIVAGYLVGRTFRLRRGTTGEPLALVATQHQYSYLAAMSPCGEYVAYYEPRLIGPTRVLVQHIPSGRRADLGVSALWHLESWSESPEKVHTTTQQLQLRTHPIE